MQESVEIRAQMQQFRGAMETGDTGFIDSIFSRHAGVLAIGTDPNEWWQGYKTVTDVFKAQLRDSRGLAINSSNLQAYERGDVGWAADELLVRMHGLAPIPLRITAVFQREAGRWRIVQYHASIGVANDVAFEPPVRP
jgi:hypothetical protein